MSIGVTAIILFAVFALLLFASCPISVSIVISSIVAAISSLSWDQITFITMQKMNSGVESFSLLAIPLFILAGNIMNNGGIARRLVNFAKLFVGWIPGSLAQANIVGNMLFGALSGSSVAAASAMGGCIYPIQKDEGYDPAFATAVNIASAPTGLLIPPTSAFIVYSTEQEAYPFPLCLWPDIFPVFSWVLVLWLLLSCMRKSTIIRYPEEHLLRKLLKLRWRLFPACC